jgi:parallel beta-helix repeat protein
MTKLLTVLAALAAIGLGAHAASAASKCHPVLTPGEDLTRVADNCPPSTTFTIKDGTYKLSGPVEADSGDTFKGVYSDRTRPNIDANGATRAFDVGGTNRVTIRGLSVTGTKGGVRCKPWCGSAIKGDGTNLHVLNVRLHHNPNQGIGNPGDGFLLENSEIDHNGSYSFTALDGDSGKISSSAGVKITNSTATFRNNKIHHNYWHGIWCDRFGGPIVATGNDIYDNDKSGIKYEKCRGGALNNNTVTHNGYLRQGGSVAGILLQTPQSVEIANNDLEGNREYGIRVKHGDRQRRIFGVRIHHNSLRNDTLKGCQKPGVKCWTNGR